METETAEAPTGIDIDAASDQIGAELFPSTEPAPDEALVAEAVQDKGEEAAALTPSQDLEQATTPEPTAKAAPKSWPKEMHDHWGKVPPEVQTYWETREKQMLDGLDQYKGAAQYGKALQDVIMPFEHILRSQGLDAPRAVQSLLSAHQRLTAGTVEQRTAAYQELGQRLGLSQGIAPQDTAAQPVDPTVRQLEERFQRLEHTMTVQQQAALEAARTKVSQEVNAFASDPKHDLFNDCYEDIVKFITAGESLQDAYDKAVWANPVTREKQVQSRVQTETEKAKERARLDALPKTKAKSVNMRGRDTMRAPTEPLGSMEDTMKSTLVSIRNKTIH